MTRDETAALHAAFDLAQQMMLREMAGAPPRDRDLAITLIDVVRRETIATMHQDRSLN